MPEFAKDFKICYMLYLTIGRAPCKYPGKGRFAGDVKNQAGRKNAEQEECIRAGFPQ